FLRAPGVGANSQQNIFPVWGDRFTTPVSWCLLRRASGLTLGCGDVVIRVGGVGLSVGDVTVLVCATVILAGILIVRTVIPRIVSTADRGQGADGLDEIRINEVGCHRGAWIRGGGTGVVQVEGPFSVVVAESGLPVHPDDPLVGGIPVGIPHRGGQVMTAGREGGGENLPQGELGGAVLAYGM